MSSEKIRKKLYKLKVLSDSAEFDKALNEYKNEIVKETLLDIINEKGIHPTELFNSPCSIKVGDTEHKLVRSKTISECSCCSLRVLCGEMGPIKRSSPKFFCEFFEDCIGKDNIPIIYDKFNHNNDVADGNERIFFTTKELCDLKNDSTVYYDYLNNIKERYGDDLLSELDIDGTVPNTEKSLIENIYKYEISK